MNENEAENEIMQDAGGVSNDISPLANTSDPNFNNINSNILENIDLNQSFKDSTRYLDQSHLYTERDNVIMALKVPEYKKTLTEKDFTIESLQTDIRNYQQNFYNLNKSKTSMLFNTNLQDMSERINGLGNAVDFLRIRQNDVVATTNTFQEKIIHMSCIIDNTLKQVKIEKERLKQDLENVLCSNELEYLKSENEILNAKLNVANIKLNEEKESVFKNNQYFEKVIKYKADKYDEILAENQSLKDELAKIKMSLNENKNQLDLKLKTIEDQTEVIIDNLKQSDILKKDNCTLKERIQHLEKTNDGLMDDISQNVVYQKTIQEEKENNYKNYDHTLKNYEENILQLNKELKLQKENEYTIQNEVINLKQEVQSSNNKITNLQEELKVNLTLIPELQNKIYASIKNLNNDLTLSYKKLQDCITEFAIEKSKLEKDKNELENQFKEQLLKLNETTSNYMEYKSKAKLLYSEITKIQQHYYQLEQKISPECKIIETIEISDGEENIDVSIEEFVDEDVSNKKYSKVSYKTNQRFSNYLSKRNLFSMSVGNNTLKRQKTINNTDVPQSTDCSNKLKQNCTQIINNSILNLQNYKETDNKYQVNSFSNIRLNVLKKSLKESGLKDLMPPPKKLMTKSNMQNMTVLNQAEIIHLEELSTKQTKPKK
ncbi:Hypothetical protein CINCED_3A019754 [Cinara cedri]|uniref:Uncharacterized protein n=1 Tax=Cinara cedri TaxID=506608 RepID=A0A5E4M4J8_9HEMI|nr:Hypothetical protein CINCED_3A019754 [Cinara cedri]